MEGVYLQATDNSGKHHRVTAGSTLPPAFPLTRQSAAGIVLATAGFPLGYCRAVLGSVIASVVRAERSALGAAPRSQSPIGVI